MVMVLLTLLYVALGEEYSTDYWHDKGKAFYVNGSYDEAILCCDEALNLDPGYTTAWYNKGLALKALGKYNDSIDCYNEAIRLDPEFAGAWNSKGNALYDLSKYNDAIDCYNEVLRLDPEYADAWNSKGAALYYLSKYNDAIDCYDEAIRLDPEYTDAWNNKGLALDYLDRYDEAIRSFKKAGELDPSTYESDWTMRNVGISHFNSGEYLAALRYYDEAIKLDPDNPYHWYSKGMALRMLHRHSGADTAFTKARTLGYSGDPNVYEMSGLWK
jgi:tetratricopeptide (TPR) repeat protein